MTYARHIKASLLSLGLLVSGGSLMAQSCVDVDTGPTDLIFTKGKNDPVQNVYVINTAAFTVNRLNSSAYFDDAGLVTFTHGFTGYTQTYTVYFVYDNSAPNFGTGSDYEQQSYTTCDDPSLTGGGGGGVQPGGTNGGGGSTGNSTNATTNSATNSSNLPAIGTTSATTLSGARTDFRTQHENRPVIRADRGSEAAAPSGAPEVLISGSKKDITAAITVIEELGGDILRRTSLGNLGLDMIAIDLKGIMTEAELKALLSQKGVDTNTARNNTYRSSSGQSYADRLVGATQWQGCGLRRSVKIGIIDGPLSRTTAALGNVPIIERSFLDGADQPGTARHGTELAVLIAGQPTAKTPGGLAQGAEIYSAVAVSRVNGREAAELYNIAQSLDWMQRRGVKIINMSLAGPQNDLLEELIDKVTSKGIIVVAATGNQGASQVAYPAAHPDVIAVTAVDASKRLYRRANRGAEVDFAAPGVEILLPRGNATTYKSGTSYATAFATAIFAQKLANGSVSQSALVSAMRQSTEDLGPAGKDTSYGYGLLKVASCQ